MSDTRIRLPHNGWRPRAYQEPLWAYLKAGGKRGVAVWHRRAGKDDVALHATACAMFERVGTYWHMLPEASQARKAVWEAVNPHSGKRRIDEAFPFELRAATRENEMFIRFKNGSTWQVVGSDNYNSLVGSPPIGIIFSEWALANPASWAYLRPILRENGGWALFIYTPRGRNHGATIYEEHKADSDWFVQKLTAEQTDVFTKEDLAKELRDYSKEFGKDDGESRYRQEYLCDFNVALIGALFGRQMTDAEDDGRITSVPHDKAVKVNTWWDLGWADPTAIWFLQHVGGEIHVIDYHEGSGSDVDVLAKILQEKREERGFTYGDHIWPADGGHKLQASRGRSLAEMFSDLGFTANVQKPFDLQPGITRTRQILPRCWFDRERTANGIEAMRSYHREWDEVTRSLSVKPRHDWSSHGATAFMTGAMSHHDANAPRVVRRDRYSGDSGRKSTGWAA